MDIPTGHPIIQEAVTAYFAETEAAEVIRNPGKFTDQLTPDEQVR